MKVNLVVAAGVHEGKAIPVPGSQLLIGRDPECNLRPASPAVSKKHCLISVRNGSVFVKDLGSTNGTTINDAAVAGEQEVANGDRLKVGPLDFFVQILRPQANSDSTPLPDTLKPLPPGTGGKLLDGVGLKPLAPPSMAATPAPMAPVPVPKPAAPAVKTEAKPAPAPAAPKPKPVAATRSDDPDALAAAMMAEGDESDPMPVPDGSTVVELPAMDLERIRMGGAPAPAPAAAGKKAVPSAADSSNAAHEALKKYFERKKK
jgi:pSer/pThr/pTyr-binding forkhead associated (FHA) protein